MDNNIKYPRILVISSNAFSDTSNNGKTLASFFKEFPENKVAQLYFNSELPENSYYHNYFRITDYEMVKSIITDKCTCGNKIKSDITKADRKIQEKKKSLICAVKNYNISRIIREILWKSKNWKTEELNQWLEEFSPEIIFLCAGDGVFTYDITKYIKEKFGAKLVVYITDDYVLPRKTVSPFWWLRRNYIIVKMKDAIQQSDLFITISQQMQETYKEMFNKDSILAVNMTESMRDESVILNYNKETTLVYAGGLHYKRYTTLNLLAKAIKKYNDDSVNEQKVYLKIYSEQDPNNYVLKCLNVEGASKFCGRLNQTELREVLNSCDIPVHVESFDAKSIESTRLSISTKIPEYLSLGKPVLAIGPNQVASIEYLKDSAFCITDKDDIYFNLKALFDNKSLLEELSSSALLKFEQSHNKDQITNEFISYLIRIYEGK